MSFTSHTFTSLPLVHTLNPDFLRRQLWLCFLLVRECSRSGSLHAPWFPNSSSPYSRISQIPEVRGFAGSWLWVFTNSQLQGRAGLRLRVIARSRLQDFESSGVQTQIFVSYLPLKTSITNFINLDVSRGDGFSWIPQHIFIQFYPQSTIVHIF
jgi:hypothetical protein